jgi:hypothetical protein
MSKLVEGEDYYWETVDDVKYRVFTEAYHKKRGFCCKNNCRHCAYKKDDEKKEDKKD